MRLPSADFESAVSANFTTRPYQDCTAERGAGTSSERGLYRAAGERGPEGSRKRVQGETERVSPCRAMSAQENGEATASRPHRCVLFSREYTCPLKPLRSPASAGYSSCRHLHQFCGFGGGRLLFRDGRLQCSKDDAGSLLDDFQALGQQRCVAVVKLDVVCFMLCST